MLKAHSTYHNVLDDCRRPEEPLQCHVAQRIRGINQFKLLVNKNMDPLFTHENPTRHVMRISVCYGENNDENRLKSLFLTGYGLSIQAMTNLGVIRVIIRVY